MPMICNHLIKICSLFKQGPVLWVLSSCVTVTHDLEDGCCTWVVEQTTMSPPQYTVHNIHGNMNRTIIGEKIVIVPLVH